VPLVGTSRLRPAGPLAVLVAGTGLTVGWTFATGIGSDELAGLAEYTGLCLRAVWPLALRTAARLAAGRAFAIAADLIAPAALADRAMMRFFALAASFALRAAADLAAGRAFANPADFVEPAG
jgi:hypothetical protein